MDLEHMFMVRNDSNEQLFLLLDEVPKRLLTRREDRAYYYCTGHEFHELMKSLSSIMVCGGRPMQLSD